MVSSMKYELEIVSLMTGAEQRIFKKYSVGGVETVGVDKKEPFFIRFKNNTDNKVQVRLAIDGTDVLSGKEAVLTDKEGQFWLVEAKSKLEVKAWPETNNGGAGFIFGEPGKGVAANTHGNTKNVGLISASVFTEGYSKYEPVEPKDPIFLGGFGVRGGGAAAGNPWSSDYYIFNSSDVAGACDGGDEGNYSLGIGASGSVGASGGGAAAGSFGGASFNSGGAASGGVLRAMGMKKSPKREEKVAVGAREYVPQPLTEVPSFTNPMFDLILTLNYEHWDSLVAKLNEEKRVNLSNVPRQLEIQYPRVRQTDSTQYRF